MLEKTAASLEPCGFQRVVPGATKSFRTTRQLRSSFWQHGAADIELTTAWQALMHGTFDLGTGTTAAPEEGNRSSTLSASAFLLDFLYPSGAINLMRRLTPSSPSSPGPPSNSYPGSFRHRQSFSKLAPRLYMPTLPRRQDHRSEAEPATDLELYNADSSTHEQESDITYGGDAELGHGDHLEELQSLLSSADPENADHVWLHYKALDGPLQADYMIQVLNFLSTSGRLTDSWKISELFHKLPISQWDNYTFIAGVTAELNLQNFNSALELFVQGLKHESLEAASLVDAFDLLLADALRSSIPELLKALWKNYPEMAARWEFEGITSQLRYVSSVPGLAERALDFQAHGRQQLQEPTSTEISEEVLDTLQKILVRRALVACADSQIIPLLNVTKDPLAFEEFLRQVTSRGKHQLGIEVYDLYRDLPGSTPSHNVLYEIFKAYTGMVAPLSAKYYGLELLWGDWYRFHTAPSRRAFSRYLAFYAAGGDVERVRTLWTKSIELYRDDPEFPVLESDDIFAHLLHVHAVRGENEEAQRIFDDISGKFSIEPNLYCWNILLNAYVKAGDYDGAISVFEKLAAAGEPDKYSYGTIMQMAGDRGDLGFTIDLYRRAQKSGIPPNDAILSSLVDAYCQNDHLKEAEHVCVRAVTKGIVATRMWNKLIHYHALHRDLAGINNLLNLMAEKDIPYNQFTYQQLLLGLSLCRQSQHALHLLAVALKDRIFEVTPDHFHIVMGALLITGEPAAVQRLHKLMQDQGFPSSSGTLFRLTQALGQWKNLPTRQRSRLTATQWLGAALRSFYRIYGLGDRKEFIRLSSPNTRRSQKGELLGMSTEKLHFSTMVYMFTQLKDFVQAREFVDLYRYVFQSQDSADGILPVTMLNSVMLADFQENHHDRVRATWDVLFETAKKEARSADYIEELPHTPKISPKYRYILSGGLEVMQRLLFTKGDAAGIQKLIKDVRDEGFEIDSKNWNYYIQVLVQLKQYKEAFFTCEKILMPNWTGWFVVRTRENVRNKLPLDLRRKGASPRYLRPVATTLYRLAQGYTELDQLAPWSAEAAKAAKEIEKECMQVVRAIKSMIRVHSKLEYEIFGQEESFDSIDARYDDEDYPDERQEEEVAN
ncbi:hypothetical protein AAE478_002285 [Parahypoxylon ruwenzoriense]